MIKRLLKHFKGYEKFVLFGLICVLIDVICEIKIPEYMSKIIDYGIVGGQGINYILTIGAKMVIVGIIAIITGAGNAIFTAYSSQGMGNNLRTSLFDKIMDFSSDSTDNFTTASLVTRITSDVNTVQFAFMMSLRLLLRAPLMLILSLNKVVKIDLQLSSLLLIVAPILIVVFVVLFKIVNPIFAATQKKLDQLNQVVQENIIAQRVVKAFVRQDYEEKKFKKTNEELMNTVMKALTIMMLMMPIVTLVMNGTIIGALWFGGAQVGLGNMGIGELNSFISYSMQILMSLIMTTMILTMVGRSQASAKRIVEVLDTEPTIVNLPGSEGVKVESGDVEFKDVFFCYPSDGSGETLSNISFKVKQGDMVAIVSSTGEGKSTLVNLIPRLYDVDDGAVVVGGRNIKDYSLETLRGAVGMVPQKNLLFTGTILENVMWGNPNATEKEVMHACIIAQAHDFITNLPDGYDTIIEQGGTNVSGGQRQRICIARAILKNPKVLILDDSTSAVDTATEKKILEGFNESLSNTTIFMVAQRISSVKNADSIIVLDDGKISGIGTHNELLKSNRIYFEINNSQENGVR